MATYGIDIISGDMYLDVSDTIIPAGEVPTATPSASTYGVDILTGEEYITNVDGEVMTTSHNSLSGIQGGMVHDDEIGIPATNKEYYHLSSLELGKLQNVINSSTLYIDSINKRVGIGIPIPNQTLQVKDKICVKGDFNTNYDDGQLVVDANSTNGRLSIGFDEANKKGFIQTVVAGDDYYPLILQPRTAVNSTVGIGTTPAAHRQLHITGSFQADSPIYPSLIGSSVATSAISEAGDVLYAGRTNSAATRGLAVVVEANSSTPTGTTIFQGINGQVYTSTSFTNDLTATGTGGSLRNRYLIAHQGSGTVSVASAVVGDVYCNIGGTGTITQAHAFFAGTPTIASGKTITNFYGLRVQGGTPVGYLTNRYGLYVDNLAGGINRFGIYQAGSSDLNYFAGKVGLGNNNPVEQLDITGNIKLTGYQKNVKISTTPTLTDGESATYTKGNYFVIAYNDAGTIKYRYMDLTSTNATWTYTTTAP